MRIDDNDDDDGEECRILIFFSRSLYRTTRCLLHMNTVWFGLGVTFVGSLGGGDRND